MGRLLSVLDSTARGVPQSTELGLAGITERPEKEQPVIAVDKQNAGRIAAHGRQASSANERKSYVSQRLAWRSVAVSGRSLATTRGGRTTAFPARHSGYVGAMIPGDYRDMLVAIATSAGALTGLLFVALSVAPRRQRDLGPQIVRQIRAAAALLAFSNALSVSLFSLVPGTNVGYPAVALGVIGVAFTAAAMRSIITSPATPAQKRGQASLIMLLLLIFGTELIAGIIALGGSISNPPDSIGYALVASLIVGISRAWELVSDIDTGLMASVAALIGYGPRAQSDDSAATGDLAANEGPATDRGADGAITS